MDGGTVYVVALEVPKQPLVLLTFGAGGGLDQKLNGLHVKGKLAIEAYSVFKPQFRDLGRLLEGITLFVESTIVLSLRDRDYLSDEVTKRSSTKLQLPALRASIHCVKALQAFAAFPPYE